ncbi:MAG: efflux RND transporter periplasmic adaptor subunit, partial [Planctomycetota bacterium]|nr:efflux RND transporter periplasmic adaptor subunit [Planctomycetota bacterium]
SPVNGVIIDRRVNVGQTVVASLNAPSLFLIAKDLKRLQVWASVNEADIGQIHLGQSVKFTVDAQAGEVFRGVVAQIRLNATMTQNVVTYTVVVSTENPDGKLLPYLTANLQFERATQTDVLLVPNIALRWQPRRTDGGKGAGGTKLDSGGGKKPKGPGDPTLGKVWVRDGDSVRPIDVTVGLTDGVVSEVSGEGIVEGLELIVGDVVNETGGQTSPFAPKMTPGGTPSGGSGGGRGGGGKTP